MTRLFVCLSVLLLVHSAVGWSSAYERQQEKEKDTSRAGVKAFSASISELAGVFKQVSTAGEPIYKHVGGVGDWGMRQINTAGQAIYKPSYFGSAVNGLGKVFWFGAVATEAVNVVDAAKKDLKEGSIKHTVHAGSKAVGGWTGASYGAAWGASIGSFVPVVGTLAGGVVGGMVGALTGTVVGDAVAEVAVGQT